MASSPFSAKDQCMSNRIPQICLICYVVLLIFLGKTTRIIDQRLLSLVLLGLALVAVVRGSWFYKILGLIGVVISMGALFEHLL